MSGMMGQQMSKMAMTMLVLYVVSQVDKTDPTVIFYSRVFFGAAMTLIVGMQLYVLNRIQAVKDPKEVVIKASDREQPNALASMLGVKPEDMQGDQPAREVMTTAQYDESECRKWISGTFSPALMILGMHWYWQLVPPLLMMPANQLFDLFSHNLVRVYILGQTIAQHPELKRPFPKPKGFMDQLNESQKEMKQAAGIESEPARHYDKNQKSANLRAVRAKKA